jgi:hypothetical protein
MDRLKEWGRAAAAELLQLWVDSTPTERLLAAALACSLAVTLLVYIVR